MARPKAAKANDSGFVNISDNFGSREERQARHEAAQETAATFEKGSWRDPNAKFKDDDNSADARMWRLNRDHQEMGSR